MLLKLFKNTTLYALGPQIPKIASIFILPIITKDLTPFDYGISGLVSAYLGAIVAFKLLGLEDIIINYYFKKRSKYKLIWSHLFSFLSRYIILFTLVTAVLLYFIFKNEIKDQIALFLILVITPILFFDLTIVFGSRYYMLKQNFKPVMIISASSGLITVFLNLFTISYLKMGFMGWYVSLTISTFFTFLCYSYPVFYKLKLTPFIRPRFKYIKRYLRISFPLVPNLYGNYILNSSDRVIMDIMRIPTAQLGLYTIGSNIGNISVALYDSFAIAIGPALREKLSLNTEKALNYIRELTFVLQFLFFGLTVTASIWAKEAFQLLISDTELALSYDVAIFMIMSQNHGPLKIYYTNAVIFREDTNLLWKITLSAGLLNVLLNIILIPIYGYMIAAATTLVSMLFLTLIGFYFKKYKSYGHQSLYPELWMFISLALTFLVYVIRDVNVQDKLVFNFFYLLVIGVFIYFFTKRLKKYN